MLGDLLGSMGKQQAKNIVPGDSFPRGEIGICAVASLLCRLPSRSPRGPCKTVVHQGVARLGEPLLRFVDPGLVKASFRRPGPQNETSIAFAMLTP